MMRSWLRDIREMQDMTEKAVADAVGVAQSVYHRYETGQRNPTVWNAKKIAQLLGFDWKLFYSDKVN